MFPVRPCSRNRRAHGAVPLIVIAALVLLTACSEQRRTVVADQFLGQPLDEVYRTLNADPDEQLPHNFGYVLYGMSTVATSNPVRSGLRLGRPPGEWVVVVSCATVTPSRGNVAESQTLVLGITERAITSASVLERARQHAFDGRVSECANRVPAVSLPVPE